MADGFLYRRSSSSFHRHSTDHYLRTNKSRSVAKRNLGFVLTNTTSLSLHHPLCNTFICPINRARFMVAFATSGFGCNTSILRFCLSIRSSSSVSTRLHCSGSIASLSTASLYLSAVDIRALILLSLFLL